MQFAPDGRQSSGFQNVSGRWIVIQCEQKCKAIWVCAETMQYFGKVIESGVHQASLQMILDRRIDASAIDSTVLELEFQRYPAIRSKVRIIETLGPSPIPPWVIFKSLSQELRKALRELLLHMHKDPQGRATLGDGQMARSAYVEDGDYDAIRRMARKAELVTL